MIIWALWKNRNESVWNGIIQSPTHIVNFASSTMIQWEAAQKAELKDWRIKPGDGAIAWNKPKHDAIKCNVDGAIFAQKGLIGFGCVVHDGQGIFRAAKQGIMPGLDNAMLAEAITIREALSWIKEKFTNAAVVLESDSLGVIQAIRGLISDNTYVQSVINDCLKLLEDLPMVSCVFVRRSANRVAHALAKASGSLSDFITWEGHPPQFICNLLEQDLMI
ncbi:hypothetical protein DH2020_047560 [Rehmannia glutinosa]|uniref:RNase H type-1 domain-containing protein n=1 Tax=Rehmannia glutinosa TaxID=99300 RepID=A0ABR0U874_REHGL